MGQTESHSSPFASGVLLAVSAVLHGFSPRILPANLVCLGPSITWGFSCLCLRKCFGHSYLLLFTLHVLLASVWSWKFANSNALVNRIFLYPLVGSSLAFILAPYMPPVPRYAMLGVLAMQGWSILGGILMFLIFPASIRSCIEPQDLRERWLSQFMRQSDGRRVESHTILSRNGVSLDLVSVQREDKTDRWIVYFGGNAEVMEDSAEDMSGLTGIVRANWIFYNARGVGRSNGYVADVRDLVDDAVAVVQFSSKQYSIPPNKLLLWGHSIGGGIAVAVARREGKEYPLLLDRTFSRLTDAAVGFSPLHPIATRLVVQYTVGNLDVVSDCRATRNNKKLVIYHRMDEVIPYDIASLGRRAVRSEAHVKDDMVIELHSTRVQSPHNSLLSAFEEEMKISRCITALFS